MTFRARHSWQVTSYENAKRYEKRDCVGGAMSTSIGKTKGILGCPDLREDLRRMMIGKHNLARLWRRLHDISCNKVELLAVFT